MLLLRRREELDPRACSEQLLPIVTIAGGPRQAARCDLNDIFVQFFILHDPNSCLFVILLWERLRRRRWP
jgi:hypothetical protein